MKDGCPTNSGSLGCCAEAPCLVLVYHAKVTKAKTLAPIPRRLGPNSAEWSGSTTNVDKEPGECKPPAMWSFTLGRDFTLGQKQIHHWIHHPDGARGVQSAERLSHDLTHVTR